MESLEYGVRAATVPLAALCAQRRCEPFSSRLLANGRKCGSPMGRQIKCLPYYLLVWGRKIHCELSAKMRVNISTKLYSFRTVHSASPQTWLRKCHHLMIRKAELMRLCSCSHLSARHTVSPFHLDRHAKIKSSKTSCTSSIQVAQFCPQ